MLLLKRNQVLEKQLPLVFLFFKQLFQPVKNLKLLFYVQLVSLHYKFKKLLLL